MLLFVATLFFSSTATAQRHTNLESRRAWEDGAYTVVIEWVVKDAALIDRYSLERSMTGNASDFQSHNIRCENSGRTYRCEDTDLFKTPSDETASTQEVSYRLLVTHPDGTIHTYFQISVEYTTNAVRRTWGSIKSMFQ